MGVVIGGGGGGGGGGRDGRERFGRRVRGQGEVASGAGARVGWTVEGQWVGGELERG